MDVYSRSASPALRAKDSSEEAAAEEAVGPAVAEVLAVVEQAAARPVEAATGSSKD
jgi:hypothetical protein